MKSTPTTILPLKGYSDLLFGERIEVIIQKLGEADQLDQIEGAEPGSLVLHYNQPEMSLFFEGYDSSILAFIETRDKQTQLFDQEIFKLNKDEIIELMAANGHSEYEKTIEEGDELISFDFLMIDFYFDKDQLIAVSWGVLLDEQGSVFHL